MLLAFGTSTEKQDILCTVLDGNKCIFQKFLYLFVCVFAECYMGISTLPDKWTEFENYGQNLVMNAKYRP